jgi:16S rRNA (guanine966-N2)-methyltransferase
MRIIAGERRGHGIEGSATRATRATSDMVRESIFNILGDAVEGRPIYDVFAGTGALGLEALSRGAASAVFIERDRSSLGVIRRNIARLRYDAAASVVGADAYRWMTRFTPIDDDPVVVFLDPPYDDYRDHPNRLAAALSALVARLPAGSTLVLEAPEKLDMGVIPEPTLWDRRRYGDTRVAFRTLGTPSRATASGTGPASVPAGESTRSQAGDGGSRINP